MSEENQIPVFTATRTLRQTACSACGRSMVDAHTQTFAIGCELQITPADADAFKRIYPELTVPMTVSICYVCWLKSLGVTPDYTI